ncbi:MAG: 50S ribosomal protein L17 [Candidatus Rokubacteria bacterium]|nr:50S ribosomal protein L17 [Candidatus Rokubacteria bacterium]
MRHGRAGKKLGRVTAHRWALFRNLLTALFRHERITTTEAKAKAVRGLADGMITLAKRESLHARRQALRLVPDETVVKKLFDTVAARYAERHGGYTRIVKAGHRAGDNAPMVLLELVDRPPDKKDKEKTKAAEAAKGRRGKKQKAAAAAGS